VPELGCELDDVDTVVVRTLAKLSRTSRGRVSRGMPTAIVVGWKTCALDHARGPNPAREA
jgi:hypothetical protein